VIEIRTMRPPEIETVDTHLPLDRLDQPGGEWLVAWEDGLPVGHVHLDWRPDPPEVQNLYVLESHRRRGIGTLLTGAAEERVQARGFDRIALEVDVDDPGPRALYEKLGYRQTRARPQRKRGTILLRGEPFSFDATLLELVKQLD
jgi:ribosomal protein S18 acetylase RimI-like enzyme